MASLRRPVVLAVLFALSGCPQEQEEKPCGDLAAFDLSSCDLGSLSAVDPHGIWNVNVSWDVGGESPMSWNLNTGQEAVNGYAAQKREMGPESFKLSSTFEQRSGLVARLAFAGCSAPAPTQVTGKVTFCRNGIQVTTGNFEAVRLARIAGEPEASGLRLISETPLTQGIAADVWVHNGYAYVSALRGGLTIFDVSNPAAPQAVAQLAEIPGSQVSTYWNDAKVVGNSLYVATLNGVKIFDVTDPTRPGAPTVQPADGPSIHTIQVDPAGNRMYAISTDPDGEVLAFGISNPASPILRHRIKATGADPAVGNWPHDATYFNGRLYVNHWALGFIAFDVPAEGAAGLPAQRGTFTWEKSTSHASQVGMINGKTIAFEGGEAWNAHLRVVDFTNPDAPSLLAEWQLRRENSIHNMVLDGTTLYVAHYQEGLRILDVSNPASPVPIAHYNTWRETDPDRGDSFYEGVIGVRVPGDGRIYVAETNRGLMIFERTNP
jgi:hypothetical protein